MPQVVDITKASGDAFARGVSHHQSQSALGQDVKIVEVSSYFPGGLVIGSDVPALRCGHGLGERGLLDASRYPEFLLYALALARFFFEAALHQRCEATRLAPLLGYLAPGDAVYDDACRDALLASGPQTH
jgi:hypothetical protein